MQTPLTKLRTSTEFSRGTSTPFGNYVPLQMAFSTNKKINGSQNVKYGTTLDIAPSSLNNRSVNTPMNMYGVPVIKVVDKASVAVRNVSIGSRPTSSTDVQEVAPINTSFSRFGMIGRLQNVSNCTSCGKLLH